MNEIERAPQRITPDEVIPPRLRITVPPWMKRLLIDEWKWRRATAIETTCRLDGEVVIEADTSKLEEELRNIRRSMFYAGFVTDQFAREFLNRFTNIPES